MPITTPPLDDVRYQALVDEILRRIPPQTPEWTDTQNSDPGITLVELFAYLTETLLNRTTSLPDLRRQAALRLADAAQALVLASIPKAASTDQPCGLKRINYFEGKLLSAEDLTAEQEYHREKLRRHNRHLHGTGIVRGLGIRLDANSGIERVQVDPGVALDPNGEELTVCEALILSLPLAAPGSFLLVQVAYAERPARPVPSLEEIGEPTELRYSHIQETCVVSLAPDPTPTPTPTPTPGALVLARLKYVREGWVIDRKFKAPRIRFAPALTE